MKNLTYRYFENNGVRCAYVDYEGIYTNLIINENGWCYNKRTARELGPKEKNRYYQIFVTRNYVTHAFYLHRMVLQAFGGELPENWETMQCNHINEIKSDNSVSNLEWCTAWENANHGSRNRRIGEGNKRGVFVLKGDSFEPVGIFSSRGKAARDLGFSDSSVSKWTREGKIVNGMRFVEQTGETV